MLQDYIRIYTNIENLKENINKYLFDKNSSIGSNEIGNQLMKIKSEDNLHKILPYINTDIYELEERFKVLVSYFGIDIEEINSMREEVKNNYINNSYDNSGVIDKYYLKEIINSVKNSKMYSLKSKSRYGSMSSEYDLKNKEDIIDFNDEEVGGEYCPILVVYKPAKYNRGSYVLEDKSYVYIKRQPLDALIKQERLEERGIDGMGAITYIKLKRDLTNENLQEIMAELYVYGQKNDLKIENIKLADITSNKIWLTADRLKKEYKELRYYHKNLTQKVKDIYESTGAYYTQISGKYIFDSRELLHCYNTFKHKDINN
ncbi:hypothetical protein [Faecalimicrobium dakarense]|uniref:hypothetical protein n=1 Tax=Faecalimicrobium dakarense TaxID=1301100 RepID=UPI0004B3D456|nr:hypothetical protein [[Clostridium] dakarense]